MVLTILPECRICNGTKYYREPDPAGRGQLERCPACNPEPVKPPSDLVTVRREDLKEVLRRLTSMSVAVLHDGMTIGEQNGLISDRIAQMEAAAR